MLALQTCSDNEKFVGVISLGGGGKVCGDGKRISVPGIAAELYTVESRDKKDADVDCIRLGGVKGCILGACGRMSNRLRRLLYDGPFSDFLSSECI